MDPRAIRLYNDYIHGDMPRRDFLRRLAGIAGRDARIDTGIAEFRRALDEHRVAYSLHMYPGTPHGLHNDTRAARYDADAARLAWARTLALLDATLRD